MTGPQSGWVDPNPPKPDDGRTRMILAVSGAVLTIAVLATLVGVVLLAADDRNARTGPAMVLIPANAAEDETFTRSILVTPVAISDQAAARTAELLRQVPVRADRGVRTVSGRQPGLYGATGETPVCDVVTLANALDAGPEIADIWGLALGLTPQQLPYYLNTLTPVVLMADTWVTVHVLDSTATSSRQAVLQAGNAVLVDPLGVPRVRCASGDPLTPPANDILTQYALHGEPWTDFAPQTVVAVNYAAADRGDPTGAFTLLDVGTGQQLNRDVGDSIDLGGTSVPLPDPAVMNVPAASPGPEGRR